jgi:hypothetical protein
MQGGSNQQWQFIPVSNGNGNFEIMNALNGLVLDDPGFSTSNGQKIQQCPLNGGLNQQWQLIYTGGGYDEIRNAFSGKVLDDPGFSTSPGTQIQQYQLNGGSNQQWRLLGVPVDGRGPEGSFEAPVINAYSGLVLTDPGFSTSNGTLIQQNYVQNYPYVGVNQQWFFVPLANSNSPFFNGNYLIVNSFSGKVLDDPGGSTSPGTPIQQFQLHGGPNQQWQLIYSGGDVEIRSASSGLVLEDPAFSPYSGTVIQQNYPLGGVNQLWALAFRGTFSGSLTANGVNGPINASGRQSQAINMTSNGTTLDRTSVPTGSGYNLVVTDTSPAAAAAAAQSGGNVAAEPRSGPAVGTLLPSGQPTGGLVIGGPLGMGASGPSRSRTPIGHLKDKVYLGALPGRSRIGFDKGDVGTSVLAKEGIS